MHLTVDMIIEGLSHVEVMMMPNSNVNCAVICMRIIFLIVCLPVFFRFRVSACFAYGKTVMNQRKLEKSPFEVSQRKIQCEYLNERLSWKYSAK